MDEEVAQLPHDASDEEAGNSTEAEHIDMNDLVRRLLAALECQGTPDRTGSSSK